MYLQISIFVSLSGNQRCSICEKELQTEVGLIFHNLVHSAQFLQPGSPQGTKKNHLLCSLNTKYFEQVYTFGETWTLVDLDWGIEFRKS